MTFASRHGTTFDDMLKWNNKLRKDCLNLDFGHPICVSITKGACCINMTEPAGPSISGGPPATSVSVPLPVTSATGNTAATGTTASSKPTGPATTVTLPPPAKTNEAAGIKGSMVIAAAGALLSVAYML